MPRPYERGCYIPQGIGELMDQLAMMMLSSPTFVDKLGDFPDRNIDSVFFQLNEGFKLTRRKIGEERYEILVAMSDRMRAHFEADPEGKSGDAVAGRKLIREMRELLSHRKS